MSKFVVIFCFLILGFVENNAYSQKQTVTTTPFRQISDIKKAGQLIIGMTKADYPPWYSGCLLYTSPSPRDRQKSRMPSSA